VDIAEMIYNRTNGFTPSKIEAYVLSQITYYKVIGKLKDYQKKWKNDFLK